MVKVKDGPMAEAKPATTTQSSTINNNNATNSNNTTHSHIRKPRNHNHTHHIHQTLHHYTYFHHHCTHPTENAETNGSNGAGSPAKFYFGPGFEPQISSGNYCAGPSSQNNSEYVVLFHVHPGVTIRFQIGDSLEILRGKNLAFYLCDNNDRKVNGFDAQSRQKPSLTVSWTWNMMTFEGKFKKKCQNFARNHFNILKFSV